MKNTITRILIMSSLVALTACGGGGDSTTGDSGDTSTASLSLVNAFGQTITTDSANLQSGIDTACYSENSADGIIQRISIVGSTFTNELKTFAGDLTCTGTPSDTRTIVGTLTVKTDLNIIGWQNGGADTTPPGKVIYPTTLLSTTAPYTEVNLVVTSSSDTITFPIGLSIDTGFVIDDSFPTGIIIYNVSSGGYGRVEDPYTNVTTNGYVVDDYWTIVYVDKSAVGTTVDASYSTQTTKATIQVAYKPSGSSYTDFIGITLPFDFAVGNFFTDANSINMSVRYQNISWTYLADSSNFINFTTVGNVGEKIIGTYSVYHCYTAGCSVGNGAFQLTGKFDIIRGANQ